MTGVNYFYSAEANYFYVVALAAVGSSLALYRAASALERGALTELHSLILPFGILLLIDMCLIAWRLSQ